MKRLLNLAYAAAITAAICLSYFYVFQQEQLKFQVKCWAKAPNLWACYKGDFDFTADFFGFRIDGNVKNLIDRHIFFYGAYEKPVLFFLRDLIQSGTVASGVFLDIGANTGQHSLFMSRWAKEVHAFEPYEPVLKRFRHMIEQNRIKNVVIHPIGLGNENANLPFYQPPSDNLGTGSFERDFSDKNTPVGSLPIRRGDDVLGNAHIGPVTLVKMDIEGYEKPALEGLRRTLNEHRPVVVFELSTTPGHAIRIGSKEQLLSLFPERYAFVFFSTGTNLETGAYGFEPIDQIRFDVFNQYEVVAFPVEKENRLLRQGSQP
jgi:FkbM family methyltransferase